MILPYLTYTIIPIINNNCRWGEAFRTPLSQPQLKGCGSKWLNKERWGMLLFFYSHTLYKVTAILTQVTKRKGRLDKERNTQIWIMWSKTKLWGWTLFRIFPKNWDWNSFYWRFRVQNFPRLSFKTCWTPSIDTKWLD